MECRVRVSQSSISRLLKKENWNRKAMRLISLSRSEDLRDAYREQIRQFTADELVFIDESIFSEKTGWRHRAYGPLGEEARYSADIRRGKSWSILPAYTLRYGYLDCVGIRESYY